MSQSQSRGLLDCLADGIAFVLFEVAVVATTFCVSLHRLVLVLVSQLLLRLAHQLTATTDPKGCAGLHGVLGGLLRALAPLSSGFVASNGAVARRAGPLSQPRFRLVAHPTPAQSHPALRWNVAAVAVVERGRAWTSRRWFPSW